MNMKKIPIWGLFFIILATACLLANGCKKDTDNNNTPLETGTMTDIEGNVYRTVKIGSQWWMAENLRTTKYKDGTDISEVNDKEEWGYLTEPAFCWFMNDPDTYKNKYGALYNWYSVSTGKLAPTGWHVPTDEEWWQLINYLGGGLVAGGKMKCTGTIEAGTGPWPDPNTGATNESGFSAVPTGCREEGGNFIRHTPYEATWWAANELNINSAFDFNIRHNHTTAGSEDGLDKSCGLSIRCVKD